MAVSGAIRRWAGIVSELDGRVGAREARTSDEKVRHCVTPIKVTSPSPATSRSRAEAEGAVSERC